MNKQVGILAIAGAILVILFVAIGIGDDGEEIRRGTPSTLEDPNNPSTEVTPEEEEVVENEPVEEAAETPEEPPIVDNSVPDFGEPAPQENSENVEPIESNEEPVVEETVEETVEEPAEEESVEEVTEPVVEESQEEATTTEEVIEEEPEEEVVEETPASPLVLHLMLDEGTGTTFSDSSPQGNHGLTVDADETIWTDGKTGSALRFDGVNDYGEIPHSESLNLGAVGESYSIAFWFKDDSKPPAERQIIGKGGRSGPAPFIFRLDKNGNVTFRISDGLEANEIESDNSIVRNEWRHVVGVRDAESDQIILYSNTVSTGGTVQDQTNLSIANTNDIHLNRHDIGIGYHFDQFSLDDIRIYNKALSQAEVTSLFQNGSI